MFFYRKPKPWQGREADVTPRALYINRRQIMAAGGAVAVTGLVGCGGSETEASTSAASTMPRVSGGAFAASFLLVVESLSLPLISVSFTSSEDTFSSS